MEPLTAVLSIVSIANIIVLISLIAIFIPSYRKSKAQFPLAMIVFCGFLVLHNILGAQAYFTTVHLFSGEIFPYMLGIHATELTGLLVFLKIASQ